MASNQNPSTSQAQPVLSVEEMTNAIITMSEEFPDINTTWQNAKGTSEMNGKFAATLSVRLSDSVTSPMITILTSQTFYQLDQNIKNRLYDLVPGQVELFHEISRYLEEVSTNEEPG